MSLADDALDKYKRNAILNTIQSTGPSIDMHTERRALMGRL